MVRALMLAAAVAGAFAAAATGQEAATSSRGSRDVQAAAPRSQGEAAPRSERWKRMEVHYLEAAIRHPALYYDSVQEKLKHDDAALRRPAGVGASAFYEIVQFPVQVGLTPALVFIKPFWKTERGEP